MPNTNYFLLGHDRREDHRKHLGAGGSRHASSNPSSLKHTSFVSEKGVVGGILVEGYFKTPKGYISVREMPNYPSTSTAWANGGVVSSLADLMTFAGALFDGALVSKETLAEMATPVAKEAESGRLWGLGGATLETLPGCLRHGR